MDGEPRDEATGGGAGDGHPAVSAPPPVPALDGWGRMFRDMRNTVTILGMVLSTGAAASLGTYFTLDVLWGLGNIYAGVVAYLLVPAFFAVGLLMIPIGIWRTRRLHARIGAPRPDRPYPVIDFNVPRVRLVWSVVLVLTLVNVVLFGVATYKGMEYTDSTEFCGSLCHDVMHPQLVSYEDSPHSRVSCVDCHIGEGATWFVRSKLSGIRQVWAAFTGDYSRPIPAPVENLRPARETCERCHWPGKFYGDRLLMRARYGEDEKNTPSRVMLLLKTGGGSPDLGLHGGIHWYHMEGHHEIDFVAADRQQQKIAWVRYATPEGEVFEFENADVPRPPGARVRRMDCVTCHNQPTHGYRMPADAVDHALQGGRIDSDLPFIKARGVALIKETYRNETEARTRIRNDLVGFYQQGHPQVWSQRRSSIESAARVLGDIWARNVFPDMAIAWGTYPNNAGHTHWPGCFRCHTDKMRMVSGPRRISIVTDCRSCHLMAFLDTGDLVIPRSFLGLP